jgi:hypothetical protein
MSEDYRSVWSDLGLDLAAHDALLSVLGPAYQGIYLAQKNRQRDPQSRREDQSGLF